MRSGIGAAAGRSAAPTTGEPAREGCCEVVRDEESKAGKGAVGLEEVLVVLDWLSAGEA